jgi:transposase-like protein
MSGLLVPDHAKGANNPYTGEQVGEALSVLASCGGVASRAAKETGIPASTLNAWRDERAEQYRQLQDKADEVLVNEMEGRLRHNAQRAAELQEGLLNVIEKATPQARGKEAADYIRAVADVQNKSLDGLAKVRGQRSDAPAFDLMGILKSGQHQGWLKLNVSMEVGDHPPDERPVIEGTAEDS